MKSIRIRTFFCLYFSVFVLNTYYTVIALYRIQYGKYRTSLSYFVNLSHEALVEWNNHNIWKMSRKSANIARSWRAIIGLLLAHILYSFSLSRKLCVKSMHVSKHQRFQNTLKDQNVSEWNHGWKTGTTKAHLLTHFRNFC